MPTDPDELLARRYRLLEPLGEGGMAQVFRAHDTRLNVERAVKVLDQKYARVPQVRERFRTEAQAQARLRHPHILMVHDVEVDGDKLFMVMEVADGGSLFARVVRDGPLPPQEVARTGIALCQALQVAHEAGVVHRDIKPENMLLDHHGTLKLADFGIARVVERERGLTRTGVAMGTWAYMPPEQRNSAKIADERADLYALGATLHFLTCGKEPFDLHNTEAHAEAFAGFPPSLARVIQKATRFNPDDRYQTGAELQRALESIVDGLSLVPAFVVPAPGAPPRPAETLLADSFDADRPVAVGIDSFPAGRTSDESQPFVVERTSVGWGRVVVLGALGVVAALGLVWWSGRAQSGLEAPGPAGVPEAVPAVAPPPVENPAPARAAPRTSPPRARPRPAEGSPGAAAPREATAPAVDEPPSIAPPAPQDPEPAIEASEQAQPEAEPVPPESAFEPVAGEAVASEPLAVPSAPPEVQGDNAEAGDAIEAPRIAPAEAEARTP